MSSDDQYMCSKNRLFERLQQLDDILYFPETSTRDTLKLVKQEFKLLDIFVSLQSFADESNMLDVTQKVQALFRDALIDFSESYLAEYSDFCIFKVQCKIWLIKMEIRAKYSFSKMSSLPLSANRDGIMMEFVDSMVENLPDLIDDPCSLLYLSETKGHIKDVLKELRLLQTFICFVSERFTESIQSQNLANFFRRVLVVAAHTSKLAWLYFSGCGYENQYVAALGEINVSLFLQMKVKPIQLSICKIYITVLQVLKSTIQSGGWCPNIENHEHAADIEANFLETILHYLVELLTNCNSIQRVSLKDHLVILQERLNLLRANIIFVSTQDLELLQDIDTVIIDVGLLVFSLYNDKEKEEEGMAPGQVTTALVLNLLGNIQCISTVTYHTIRKVFQSNLPRIHGLGYVDFLLNNLKEFQRRYSDSLASVTNQLQIIQKELESLQPFLKAVSQEQLNDLDEIQHWTTQLIGRTYEVEYIVDSCISKEVQVWCIKRWLLDITEEITLIRAEVEEIQKKKMVVGSVNTVTAHAASNFVRSSRMSEEIVGFEDVIENLRDQLMKGTRGRDVIPIVGMPGLGKTTLAYRLYSDTLVVSHFDIRAQCCVSQVYSRTNLLLTILREAIGEDPKHREKRDDELADELRKALFSKRYLVLVDDVWEASVWDDLIGCFQDANNGSRIILTTRHHEVANYARFQSDPLPLRMFNDDESWELLRKKVFGQESCSTPLMKIGQQIAKRCGQLPLSVALVAGILAETEKREECWEQVANNLGPYIHTDSRAVIEHSYRSLPYHLRSCFLYFGAFLEDAVIDVARLTRLWISEGFVKSCESKGLEDIAEGYLDNLVGRNLVMGTKKSSIGKIKACHIHDLLYDFCKERAKEENLLQWIIRDQNVNPSSHVHCPKQLSHRMSIYYQKNRIGIWSSRRSHVGSIILHNNCLAYDTVSYIFHSFKFLKVLDFEFTDIDTLPSDLIYLRYFSAQTRGWSISSFIANRWLLETLKLRNQRAEMSLPSTLWEMVKLRHLHISDCSFTIENAEELLVNSTKLYDLKTLSAPTFSCVQDAELILRKMPNLQELICKVKAVNIFHYCALNFPKRIEKLKIKRSEFTSVNAYIIPFHISAPCLKNLTLYDFYLHPQHLSEIASLQNLQVLKLKLIYFESDKWEVSDGEFPELRVLKLYAGQFHFDEWTVADDAFPNLEHLVLSDCRSLKEIPSYFGDILSLKSIEVKNCNEYVEKSARDIRETQVEDYQNSVFEVFIHNSDSDSED